jgi:hypothetical protein
MSEHWVKNAENLGWGAQKYNIFLEVDPQAHAPTFSLLILHFTASYHRQPNVVVVTKFLLPVRGRGIT